MNEGLLYQFYANMNFLQYSLWSSLIYTRIQTPALLFVYDHLKQVSLNSFYDEVEMSLRNSAVANSNISDNQVNISKEV